MKHPIIGAIFVGGQGRRLGGVDKALLELKGVPLHQIVVPKVSAVVDRLLVLAPSSPAWPSEHDGVEAVEDFMPAGQSIGPAGGLLAALQFAQSSYGDEAIVVTTPVDAPFFPAHILTDLTERLDARTHAAVLSTDRRLQPAFSAWRANQFDHLSRLVAAGDRALHVLAERSGASVLNMKGIGDRFLNINTPDDVAAAWQYETQPANAPKRRA